MFGDQEGWVLDVTNWQDNGMFTFCPRYQDGILVGLAMITDKCPGTLVGIVHLGGQKMADEWVKEHPDVVQKVIQESKIHVSRD